jgi:hypothetical protein
MEQRTLRLGDVVDDYCPRERRLTNHAIVALVGDAIRQTRCTTCDSEHVYKHGRVPRRKKKDETAALYDQVLADVGGAQLIQSDAPADATAEAAEAATAPQAMHAVDAVADADTEAPDENPSLGSTDDARTDDEAGPDEPAEGEPGSHGLWLAHRRLIRATLPRTDNDPPVPRPIPEFTMHQRSYQRGGGPFRSGNGGANGNGFGNNWQHGNGTGNGNANGNVPGPRHGAPRHGRPGPPGGEQGAGQPGGGSRKSGRHRGGRHRRPR